MQQYITLLDEVVFRDLPEERRRFAFIYHAGVKHDAGAAKELEHLSITTDSRRLELCAFDRYPTGADLKERCAGRVIWGWYGLEFMLKEGLLTEADLQELVVVSTIKEHAQAKGLSAVAVQPLDEDVGREGATLILNDFTTGTEPGHSFGIRAVANTTDYFWLHHPLLDDWEGRLGFTLSKAVEDHPLCKGVYGARAAVVKP
jgi:hypothetical protein